MLASKLISSVSRSFVSKNVCSMTQQFRLMSTAIPSPEAPETPAPSAVEIEYRAEMEEVRGDMQKRMDTKQALVGVVVSTKCSKSITVAIKKDKYISKYNTFLCRTKKKMAHDEEEKAKLGDIVRIVPCRPMSRMKRHTLFEIIKRPPSNWEGAPQLDMAAELAARKERIQKKKSG